jgi:hypothetical protein
MSNYATNRRSFLKISAVLVGVAALPRAVTSNELKHVAESYPPAQALGYREDASTVDGAKFPKYSPGQTCANCKQFQGTPNSEFGPCQLYPGKAVSAKGWCSGYVAKSG